MALVSIIVPCFNQAQYLDECLQSALNQTYKNWECIIVNDGSTDNTAEISKKWTEKDTRFFYFEKENGGVSSARNYGINNSKGNYILPLDGDDYISDNYLEICVDELDKNPNLKLVYGKAEKFGVETGLWNLPNYSFDFLLLINIIFCTAMYRKTDFEQLGGYDENMKHGLEDWEFWIRLLKKGGEVKRNLTCVFYYRTKETSRNTDLYKVEQNINESYNYIFNKHRECYETKNNIELYSKYTEFKYNLENLNMYLTKKDFFNLFIQRIKNFFSKYYPLKNKTTNV